MTKFTPKTHFPMARLICFINKITSFLLFIVTSSSVLLICLLKIDNFEKKSVQFELKMEILLAFQNSQEVN